jgi:hypothetical protein
VARPLTRRVCATAIVAEAGLSLREIPSHATLDDVRAMTAAPFALAPARRASAA